MPDDVKISEMSEAASLDNSAQFPYVQSMNGNLTTLKAPLTQIGTKINESMTFSNLQTTSKTIVGAINEAAQGGGVEYATELPISSTDPTDTKSYIDTKTTLVKSASGSLIHITDGGDNIPVKSLASEIVAVQSGSGTPSPSNPRAISGFDSGVVSVCGVNLWDEEWELGNIDESGQPTPTSYRIRTKNYIPCKPSTTYYFKSGSNIARLFYYDENNTFISLVINPNNSTFTTPNNCYYLKFRSADNVTSYDNSISINYPSTDTQYHAYNGNTYTFAFGQTVYGGHFDNKGNLVVTHGYIASYNGETINEPWISSMDNYVPNTSPSTGAQVVYPLANPITLAIASQDIPTISGVNNIFSNCGDTDIEYFTSSADEVANLVRAEGTYFHKYSTSEHVVGVWIDNKTLYEKTVVIEGSNLTAGQSNTIAHGISNIDFIQITEGSFIFGNGTVKMPLPFADEYKPITNSLVVIEGITDTAIKIGVGSNYINNASPVRAWITLQYTKTT